MCSFATGRTVGSTACLFLFLAMLGSSGCSSMDMVTDRAQPSERRLCAASDWATTNGLALRLAIMPTVVAPGDTAALWIEARNVGTEPFLFRRRFAVQSAGGSCLFKNTYGILPRVRDTLFRDYAPIRLRQLRRLVPGQRVSAGYRFRVLEPGIVPHKGASMLINVSDYYHAVSAGVYEVSFLLDVNEFAYPRDPEELEKARTSLQAAPWFGELRTPWLSFEIVDQ